LRPEALDRRVLFVRLRRVDAEEADVLLGPGDAHDDRVAVDDAGNGGAAVARRGGAVPAAADEQRDAGDGERSDHGHPPGVLMEDDRSPPVDERWRRLYDE